jgi:hypothetical protein
MFVIGYCPQCMRNKTARLMDHDEALCSTCGASVRLVQPQKKYMCYERLALRGAAISVRFTDTDESAMYAVMPGPPYVSPNYVMLFQSGQYDFIVIEEGRGDGRQPPELLAEWLAKYDPRISEGAQQKVQLALSSLVRSAATDPIKNQLIDSRKQEEPMVQPATPSTFMSKVAATTSDTLTAAKGEASDGAWRVAAKQSLKRTRAGIIRILRSKRVPTPLLKWIEAFLMTEEGLATYGLIAGTVLSFAPRVNARPRWKRLCKEMRVFGFAGWIDAVVDPLLDLLERAIEEALAEVPEDNEE